MALALPALAGDAFADPQLSAGYPVSSDNLFQAQAGAASQAQAVAVDPAAQRVWLGGIAGQDSGSGAVWRGAVVSLNNGGFDNAWTVDLGAQGQCQFQGFDYCQAGSSATIAGLAFGGSRLWAAGTQLDASGADPVLYIGGLDPAGGGLSSFSVFASTGASAGGVAAGASAVWVSGAFAGRGASLWSYQSGQLALRASDGAGSAGTGVLVDSAGEVWMAGQGASKQAALWRFDPPSGTLTRFDWANTLGGPRSAGTSLQSYNGALWLAGTARDSSNALHAALWRFDGAALSLAAASTNTGGAFAMTVDAAGTAWLSGRTFPDPASLALWSYSFAQGGSTLAAAGQYADAEGDAIAYGAGSLWVGGQLSGSQFAAWDYVPNTGALAGTLTWPAGFAGGSIFFFLSADASFSNPAVQTSLAAPASGSTFSYSLSLPAPSTYYLAAVYSASGSLPSNGGTGAGNPLNLSYSPFFVAPAQTTGGGDLTLRLDATPPALAIQAPVAGSTVSAQALSQVYGTASDDTGVGDVKLSLQDLSNGAWWDGQAFNAAQTQFSAASSGQAGSKTWSYSSQGLASAVSPGRAYALYAQAADFTGNAAASTSTFQVAASGSNAEDGRAVVRDASGVFWVLARDASGSYAERYDSAGNLLSRLPLPNSAASGSNGGGNSGVAFDASGNAWLEGDSSANPSQLSLWKVSSDGSQVLAQSSYTAPGGQSFGAGVSVDAAGTVWVAGVEQAAGGAYQADLWKFDASGVLQAGYPAVQQAGGGLDGALAQAADSGGLWAVGVSSNPATGALDLKVWRYDTSGALTGTSSWPAAFGSVNQLDLSAAAAPGGGVWVGLGKAFAGCSAPELALVRFDGSGVLVSSTVWDAAGDAPSRARTVAVDASGAVWAAGDAAGTPALWRFDASGNLDPDYPQTQSGGFSESSLALDASGTPWVLEGSRPQPFAGGQYVDGDLGPGLCSMQGLASLSGTLTYSAGFVDGSTVTVVLSTSGFTGSDFYAAQFLASAGTTLSYAAWVPAPSTYSVAAFVGDDPNVLVSTTPIGIYPGTPQATAGVETPGVDLSLAPDATPPLSAVTSLAQGATVDALASIAGTASDDVGVGNVALAVVDLTAGTWWDETQSLWQGGAPVFQGGSAQLSGLPGARAWTQDVVNNFGGLAGALTQGHQYQVLSQAQDFSNNVQSPASAASFVWNGPTGAAPPSAPQSVNGYALGVSSLSWSWSGAPGASSYNLYQNAALLGSTTDTSLVQTGLGPDSTNSLCVSAVNVYGESGQTCSQSVFTLAAVPGAPSVVLVGSDTISLSWTDAGNGPATRYQVELATAPDPSSVVRLLMVSTVSASFDNLTPATTYWAAVAAVNGANFQSDYAAAVSTMTRSTVPGQPFGFAGSALGISSIAWTWAAAPYAESYNVYSSSGLFLGSASTTSFAQTGLVGGEQTFVCVRGVDALGEGPQNCSPTAYTFAAAPGALSFSNPGTQGFTASWDASGNSQDVIYEVSLSTDGFATVVSTPVPFGASLRGNSASLGGLAAGTTYFARVRGQNGAGQATAFSPVGQERTLDSPPDAPVGLAAQADAPARRIAVSWQPAPSGTPAVSFRVWRGVSADTGTFFVVASTGSSPYDDSVFASGTYYYQVSGLDADGLEGARSSVASAGIDLQPPAQVSDLRVTAIRAAQGQADLAWTAPSDDFSGVSQYFLLESPIGDFSHPAATFTVAALPAGSTVTYTVTVSTTQLLDFALRSQDGAGNVSALSNTAVYDPIPPQLQSLSLQDGQVLSRPLNVSASASDNLGVVRYVFIVNGSTEADGAQGSFFFDTRQWSDGDALVEVHAYDAAGNQAAAVLDETLSYAPPAAPTITSPAQGFGTKVSTISVSGYSEPYVSVDIQSNNVDLATTSAQNGSWSFPSVDLGQEGDIALTAIAYEDRGFSAPSAAVKGAYAATAPHPPELLQAASISGGRTQLSWSAPSVGKLPTFYRVYRSTDDALLPQGGAAPASLLLADDVTALQYVDSPAEDGLYYYAATSVDGAGNESALSAAAYALTDRVPPSAQVLFSTPQPVGLGVYTPQFALSEPLSAAPIFTFTPQGGQPVALNAEALTATLWQATVTVTSAMGEAPAQFSFQGADLAGNVGTSISSGTLLVDTVGPAAALSLSRPSPVNAGGLTITATLTEAAAQPPVLTFTPQGGSAVPLSVVAASTDGASWTASLTIDTNTGDGQALLSYQGQDPLGNVSALESGTTAFFIDTVAPGEPQAVRANSEPAGQVLITWSSPLGERPAYYHVYRDGALLSTTVYPSQDGSGAYTDAPSEGYHQYQVSSLDLAGNESAPTDPTALSKAVPPSAPTGVGATVNSFGQVEVAWQASSTDTVRFNLYRATYTLASTAGVSPVRGAASPFIDAPPVDGIWHYAVTALDSVGNESSLSSEAMVTWNNGAPAVSISGVSDGAFYGRAVAPTWDVQDLLLDTATVSALLDGQDFVSGSTVSAEGAHTLVVSAANTAGHYSTATAHFTISLTPPQFAFSVEDGAALTSTTPVSVTIAVSALTAVTTSYTLSNALLGTSAPYDSGAPISRNGSYTLTATAQDQAGHVSSATVSFSLELAPAAPLGLAVEVGSDAKLSWQSPEPDVVAYRVYRDGSRVSSSLNQAAFFEDAGWTPGAHVYEVSAVDQAGVEGPRAKASVPAAALGLTPVTLTRGFFDALKPTVQNDGAADLSAGPALLTVEDAAGDVLTATATAVTAPAGQTAALSGVVAVPPGMQASTLHARVALPTDAGSSVYLTGDFPLQAQDPQQPLLEVFPGALVQGTNSPVQVRLYNRGTAPMDVITAQVQNSTYAAVDDVSVKLLTPEGTLFASGGLLQTDNGANITFAGGRQVFFVTIPPGQSFLFDPVEVLVPNTAAATLNVEAQVSTPTYSLPFGSISGARSFASTTAQGTVSQVAYTATSKPDRFVYDQGSSVTVTGQALDFTTGAPVPNAQVTVHVTNAGFDRHVDAVTDSSGSYSAGFFPVPSESGVYSLFASNPAVVTHAVQSSFTIVGFGYQYASYAATLAQNSTYSFTVDLTNTGATPIDGLSAQELVLSGSSVTLSLDPTTLPSTLAPGAKATLGLTLSALPSSTSSQFSLVVTESHGFERTLPITAAVVPAQVIPVVTPQQFAVGMLGGDVRTLTLSIANKGFDTWRSVTLTNPALDWVTIQGGADLGDLPPGADVNVTLQLAPPSSLSNGAYSPQPLLQVTSLNMAPVPVVGAIAITSSRKGDVQVSVINADKPRSSTGQGVPIPGAKVTLNSMDVAGLTFSVDADANGLAQFSQIPSGNYAWNVSAQGFQTKSGTAVIEPGMVNNIEALMPTATVSYQWSVTPTTIQDQYNITLNLTFKTDVPAPAIVVDPPAINLTMTDGQVSYNQLTITNKGLVSAFDYVLNFSGDPALSLEFPYETIPEIKPGQSISVPVKITLAHASCHSGTIGGNYGYQCAAGLPEQGAAPGVSISAGSCGGGIGGGGTGSGGGGGGFVGFTGGAALAVAVGAPTLAPTCNASGGGAGPGTLRQLAGAVNSITDRVNAMRGWVYQHVYHICLKKASPGLSWQTFYSSHGLDPSAFGLGWTASSDINVVQNADGTFTLTDANGDQFLFVPLGDLNQPLNGSGAEFARPVSLSVGMVVIPTSDGTQSVSIRDRDGNTTVFKSQAEKLKMRPTLYADKNGSTIRYDYDSATGALVKETDAHGRYLALSYDGNGHVASVSDSAGRSVSFTYDGAGQRVSDTSVDGDKTTYSYSSGFLTQITYPNGGKTNYTYDFQTGKVVSVADDGGANQLSFTYYGSSTVITDSLGRKREEDWAEVDGTRKITRIVDFDGSVTSYQFDTQFNVSQVTDPMGRVTKLQNNINGDPLAVTDAAGGVTQISYAKPPDGSDNNTAMPSVGALSGVEPSSNGGTTGGGGTAGTASIQDPVAGQVTLSYPINLPQRVTDPKGNQTAFTYDAKGNMVQAQDALGHMTQTAYDAQGHPTATKDPLGDVLSLSYNGNGALTSVTDPLGRTVSFARDALSRVTQQTNPAGDQTSFSYDNAGDILEVKDALNGLTDYSYQPGRSGRLLAGVTDANRHATTLGYDTVDRLTSVKNALDQTASLGYDSKSRLASVTTRNGQTITMTYDSLDRLTDLATPEGHYALGYDADGNMTSAGAPNGSALSFTYDSLNRVTGLTETLDDGFSDSPSIAYDADGNRTSFSSPLGSFSYGYDALNRLVKLTSDAGTFSFAYDALGRLSSILYPNGIKTTYAYDAAGQVKQILHQRTADQTAVAFDNYTYDADGNRTSVTDVAGTHVFTYDKLNRLTEAAHPAGSGLPVLNETFSYDAIGNRTADALRTNYVYDAANRIVSDSSATYTSDADGNRTSETDRASGQTTTFKYDSGNRLIEVDGPAGVIATYKYDPMGRRIEKNVGGVITRFAYDGPNIRAILDGDDTVIAKLTYAPGVPTPLAMHVLPTSRTDFVAGTYFLQADALDSAVALTNANGSLVESYGYEAFGRVTAKDAQGGLHDGSSVGNLSLYAGSSRDSETGLNHMGFRQQDPAAGVFLQEDPVGIGGGDLDLYIYVENRPLGLVDPLGLAYADFNVSAAIFTGGVMFNSSGFYFYGGFSLGSPGVALTFSPDNPGSGKQVMVVPPIGPIGPSPIGPAIVIGKDSNGAWFREFGIGTPGASVSRYWVLDPVGSQLAKILFGSVPPPNSMTKNPNLTTGPPRKLARECK